jgi:integrase
MVFILKACNIYRQIVAKFMNHPSIDFFFKKTDRNPEIGNIYLRFSLNGKNNAFSLKKEIKTSQWKNKKKGFVSDKELNYWLEQKIAQGKKIIQRNIDDGVIIDFLTFKDLFWGIKNKVKSNNNTINLYDYWKALNDKDLAKGKIKEKTTYLQRNSHLNTWRKNIPNLTLRLSLDDVDNFITKRREKGIAISSIHVDLQKLSYVLDKAIGDKLIEINIVKEISAEYLSIANKNTKEQVSLTQEERETFKAYYIKNNHEFIPKKRNRLGAFLLMCYTGLNYGEIIDLKYGDIQKKEMNDEVYYLISRKREKTNVSYTTIIPNDLLFMVYNQTDIEPQDSVFEKFDLSYCNKTLSQFFSKELGIHKHITTHIGRHTFGNLSLESGHRQSTVQKMLGHSKITQTATYAKTSTKGLLNEVARLKNENKELHRFEFDDNAIKTENNIVKRINDIREQLMLSSKSFSAKYLNLNNKERFQQIIRVLDGDSKAPFLTIIELSQICGILEISIIDLLADDYMTRFKP